MTQMFKDPGVQAEFEANGYLKIPWLTEEEVNELKTLYARLTVDTPDGFSFSMALPDSRVRAAVREGILRVFDRRLHETFVNVLPLLGMFMTKTRGDGQAQYTPSHQDWTFVDETQGDASIHIWCPLEETHARNGNLCVVPGSNRLRRCVRPAEVADSAYKPYWHALRQAEVALPTRLGEAILFDSAVVHASTINQTDSLRLVASAVVVPRTSRQVLYYQNTEHPSLIDEYLSSADYFIQKPFGARPDTFIRTLPKVPVTDVEGELRRFYPGVNLGGEYR